MKIRNSSFIHLLLNVSGFGEIIVITVTLLKIKCNLISETIKFSFAKIHIFFKYNFWKKEVQQKNIV